MKRVLVTGGSRGLGLEVCRRLLSEGCYVITSSRQLTPELSDLLKAHPDQTQYHSIDLAKVGAAAELARSARVLAGMDGFVANAAIGTEGLLTLSSEHAIRQCMEVNLIACVVLAREIIKGMLAKGGSLVFVSSVAAQTGLAGLSVYSATKGALLSFSRSLAREYGKRGIRSNCVLPGFLETEMTQSLSTIDRARLAKRTALKRLGQASDVVGAVSFLLSEEASYITGTELVVDGGF
jgi:3-oxoacyl-[acyl-carrier protein] reductase